MPIVMEIREPESPEQSSCEYNNICNYIKRTYKLLCRLFKKYILKKNKDEIKLGELNQQLQNLRQEGFKHKKEELKEEEERLKSETQDEIEIRIREEEFNKNMDAYNEEKERFEKLRIDVMEEIIKYENELKKLTSELDIIVFNINSVTCKQDNLEIQFKDRNKVDEALDNIKTEQYKVIDEENDRIELELETKEKILLKEIEDLRLKMLE